jgi:alpha-tubulin suppressor-like RCC1 family protein
MWGQNTDFFSGATGQLGDGTIVSKSSPVQTIAGGNNWKSVHCGGLVTAAIKTDGTLWVWGYGFTGEMGDNTTTSKSSPVQTIAGGNNWKQVVCTSAYTGGNSIIAIKTDGTLWVWGSNYGGQLGTNNIIHYSSPVQTVAGGANWKQIDSGFNSWVAIRDDSSDIYGDPF